MHVDDAMLLVRVAVAWLASVVTVASATLLRADSDVRPGATTLLIAMAVLAAVFWPMTASRRRFPAFLAALVALRLCGHTLLLLATTGHFAHSGGSGLFCCPSTATVGHGPLATLTANAGWLLLLVQLVVVIVLAVPLRLLHKGFLALARALTTVVRAALSPLAVLLSFTPHTPFERLPPRPPRVVGTAGRHVAGAVRRRGPPDLALVRSSLTPFVPLGACA
jgi:hypothetical protein